MTKGKILFIIHFTNVLCSQTIPHYKYYTKIEIYNNLLCRECRLPYADARRAEKCSDAIYHWRIIMSISRIAINRSWFNGNVKFVEFECYFCCFVSAASLLCCSILVGHPNDNKFGNELIIDLRQDYYHQD